MGDGIGVNTVTISSAQSLCFAISSNTAKNVANQLIRFGKVKRAYLGLVMQQIDLVPKLRAMHELSNRQALFISAEAVGSPARKAGILSGDLIHSFNNRTVEPSDSLSKQLTEDKIGQFDYIGYLHPICGNETINTYNADQTYSTQDYDMTALRSIQL